MNGSFVTLIGVLHQWVNFVAMMVAALEAKTVVLSMAIEDAPI